ncbi:MAG: TatD family hydrolase [Bacteroidota bacterium]
MYTDSHTHLYLDAFKEDRDRMIARAIEAGVNRMFLPNIDSSSIRAMFRLVDAYPSHCFPMIGLHPTSVKENYRDELRTIEQYLDNKQIIAIGESGIDLYWDTAFLAQQEAAFRIQINWARERKLPLVIHARDSFPEIFRILDDAGGEDLRGVFHSFTGTGEELNKALSYNFMIGINGIVTFKNSRLEEVVKEIPTDRILLETDAPFLAPVPYRGKRNESSYLLKTAVKIAEIYNLTLEEIGQITTRNALQLFQPTPQHES